MVLRRNKKISEFQVMGLKILGRVSTRLFLKKKNLKKNIILRGKTPFKMHKMKKKSEVSPVNLGRVRLP